MREFPILLGKTTSGWLWPRATYLKLAGSEHVALHARSGAGKTSSFSIPACFSWPGSLVVLDVKGECFTATAGHRVAMGSEVFLLNPVAMDGRSHRWDPFAAVQRQSIDRFDQITRMGFQILPEGSGGGDSDRFWMPSGRAAFIAVATLLAETPSEPLTMRNVLRAFTGGGTERLARMISDGYRRNTPYSQDVVDGLADYTNGDIRQVNGIRKVVSTHLQAWFNPRVAAATAGSDFNLQDIRRKPMSIYVAVSPGDIPRMAPLLRLFFDQLVNLNTVATPAQDPSLKWQTLVLLDEFARLGRIETLSHAAQFARGYGLRLAYIVQNKSQLRDIHGVHATADIFDNLGAEVVFGAGDMEVAKELQERLGTNTVASRSVSRPRFLAWARQSRQGVSDHPHGRPLLLAQEILGMPSDHEIVLRPGIKPMLARKIQWWRDPAFRGLVRPPPEIPELHVEVPLDDGQSGPRRAQGRAQGGLEMQDLAEALGLPERPR